jgi:pimeloyl-ACP methyl ester carboxylesterase
VAARLSNTAQKDHSNWGYASDLALLVDRVRARFHKDKVNLVAHSSGTNYGLIYAVHNPDKILAYVGVGQLANAPKNYALQTPI